MNPIELGKAIAEVGTPIITAVMLILVVGLVWYLIKRQTKREDKHDIERAKMQEKYDERQEGERMYQRNLVTNHLEHMTDSLKNIGDTSLQGIALQKEIMDGQVKHNERSDKVSGKMVKSLSLICDKLNGDSTKMEIAKAKLSKNEVSKIK